MHWSRRSRRRGRRSRGETLTSKQPSLRRRLLPVTAGMRACHVRTCCPVGHIMYILSACSHLTPGYDPINISSALSSPPYQRGDRDYIKFLISKSKSEVFSSTSSSRRRGEELGQQSHQNCLRLQRLCWGVAVKPTSKSRQALRHCPSTSSTYHACHHQRQLYGRPRQETSGARGLSAASAVSRSIGEDNMLGERARQHQGGSQLPQASFDINIKFSSMPTLAEEEVFLEGEVQVQP